METAVHTLPAPAVEAESEPERASFEELVRCHGAALYRMALRLTGNAADAEDLAQDAVIEALRAFPRFQPGTRFDRWVYRIMSHTFIDRVRRRRRHPIVSLDAPDRPSLPAAEPSPEEQALSTERQAMVREAMATLPAEFRLAVVLVDLEGLSYEEAAAAMRCALGTVRSRLHRGRLLLRERLAEVLPR